MSGRIRVAPAEERTVDGIVFASKREMGHYLQFRALERSGAILKLERQVPFQLFAAQLGSDIKAVPVAKYVADFVVTEKDGTKGIFDSKGFRTEVYKIKKKLFEACYVNQRIVEL